MRALTVPIVWLHSSDQHNRVFVFHGVTQAENLYPAKHIQVLSIQAAARGQNVLTP